MSNFDSVISNLSSQYDIDGPYDLTKFFQEGDKWLYDFLKYHYKEEYASNYRLVLYFDIDYYPYVNAPGTLVTKLQQYLMDLDISHFFVILIASSIQTAYDLQHLKKTYTNSIRKIDDFPIKTIIADNIKTKYSPTKLDNSNESYICMNLWDHFHIHTTGEVFPCCQADHRYPIGNINDNTMMEIMNSSEIKQLRQHLLNNKPIIECKKCYDEENISNTSSRIIPTGKQLKLLYKNTHNGKIDFIPKSLDIRLSNVCNFMCRMCTGSYSSKIAAEENTQFDVNYDVMYSHTRYSKISDILEILPHITQIYFAGGEPLIMKEHYEILDRLIQIDNCNIKIGYNTNLSMLSYKGKNVVDMWKHFKHITICASLDASYEHAEYIRHGTIWNDIVNNFNIISSKVPHATIKIKSNVNIYNIYNIIEFQKQWIGMFDINLKNIGITALTSPEFLSVQVLPAPFKKEVIILIDKHIGMLSTIDDSRELINQWKSIKKYMMMDDKTYLISDFFNYTDNKDTIRNESFDELFSEYVRLRNYV